MATTALGHTLVIANPASHSGRGAAAAEHTKRFFESYASATKSFDMELTHAPLDAVEMAAHASGMDTVIALGGDGVIHEVVNGLMCIDKRDRPRLGIVALGTGNDFARTTGSAFNDVETSLRQLFTGRERTLDLGLVTSDLAPCGPLKGSAGTYFMETLSFGLDAAIAIDTTDRRSKGATTEGSALFLTSSIKLALKGAKGYASTVSIDGEAPLDLHALIFTIQNGPTYGGGFRICPAADPTDGLLDLCYNVKKPWLGHLLFLLGLARFGKHTHSRSVCLRRAQTVHLEFPDEVPPCQVDGEELKGSVFDVSVEPQALRVLVP